MQLQALDKVLNDAFPVSSFPEDENRTLYVSWAYMSVNDLSVFY